MDSGADSLHESERLVVGLLKPPVAGCSDSRTACTYVRRCLLDGRACASLKNPILQVYPRSSRSSAYRNRGLRAHVMVDLVGADRLCKLRQAHNALSRCFRLLRQRGIERFGWRRSGTSFASHGSRRVAEATCGWLQRFSNLARTSEDVSSTGEHAPRLSTFRCIRGHSVECISESWSPCPRHG